MSSTRPESTAFQLNYAAIVQRSTALQEARQANSNAEKHASTQPLSTLSTAELRSPDTKSDLSSPLVLQAKPYIPSYLAAAKAQPRTPAPAVVVLRDIALGGHKNPHGAGEDWASSTNFSNSILEPDTFSWADDDECFLQSIGWGTTPSRTNPSGCASDVAVTPAGGKQFEEPQVHGSRRPSVSTGGGRGSRHRGRGGDHNRTAAGGWRMAGEGTNSHHPPQPSRATNGATSGTELSGGRFDVLANKKIMRHLS